MYTSSWAAYTVWLNRAETNRLKLGASVGALLYWWPPLAVAFGLLAVIAGDVYDRGGCIKLVKPRLSNFYYPQNYWGGNCR